MSEYYRHSSFGCVVKSMRRANIPGVGLGGDGDEIEAIERVEASFGVKLDCSEAPNWRTAGDVYRVLCKALPPEEGEKAETWTRFAQALGEDAGDPKYIQQDSLLFGAAHGANKSALITAGIAAAFIVGMLLLFR